MIDLEKEKISQFIRLIEDEARDCENALLNLPLVKFARSIRLPRPEEGWFDLAYTVTFDGQLAILQSSVDIRADKRRYDPGIKARFLLFDGERVLRSGKSSLTTPYPVFDRLVDGSWIVAEWRYGLTDRPNSAVISADGDVIRQFEIGCDVRSLQADPDGGFWVGYGDVGCLTPEVGVESGGVVRFDEMGSPVWSLNDDETTRHAFCDHVYAMNVTRQGRWSYTYPDFLLTHLDAAGGPRSLRPMMEFADALAVSGERMMLAGMFHPPGSKPARDLLVLFHKPERRLPRRPTMVWAAAVHRALNPAGSLWTARADTLHCVRGRTWHRLSIDEADEERYRREGADVGFSD